MNSLRYFIPFLIAISGNSQIYFGKQTNYSSFRNYLFSSIPRAGIPPIIEDYDNFVESFLLDENQYSSIKNWYDIRYNQKYHTVEFRMYDSNFNIEKIKFYISISLLLFCKCLDLESCPTLPDYILLENRWRACKYGRNALFIDKNKLISVRDFGIRILEENHKIAKRLEVDTYLNNFNTLFYE